MENTREEFVRYKLQVVRDTLGYADAALGEGDIADLLTCLDVADFNLGAATTAAVQLARDADLSWSNIGFALSVTGQAAHKKYSNLITAQEG